MTIHRRQARTTALRTADRVDGQSHNAPPGLPTDTFRTYFFDNC